MSLKGFLRFASIGPLLIGLSAGCAHYEPFEPTPIAEIPEGPGLLSGEDGEFVLYRDPL